MTFQNFIFLFLSSALTALSCKVSNETKFSIAKIDSSTKPIAISIDDLTRTYNKLHGQFIETSGRYYLSEENFSISTDKDSVTGKIKRFWLDVEPRLKFSKSVRKMTGQIIKVKGVIDTTFRGHMHQYLATIGKIYYWELQ